LTRSSSSGSLPGALAGIVWLLVSDRDTHQRPGTDWRNHVRGGSDGELDSRRQLRERADGPGNERSRRRPLSRFHTLPSSHHDALAMIIGMVPMALGLGDGGEQNAPLGRAVIGGLLLATFGTLTFVRSSFRFASNDPPPVAQDTDETL